MMAMDTGTAAIATTLLVLAAASACLVLFFADAKQPLNHEDEKEAPLAAAEVTDEPLQEDDDVNPDAIKTESAAEPELASEGEINNMEVPEEKPEIKKKGRFWSRKAARKLSKDRKSFRVWRSKPAMKPKEV